MSLEHRSHSGSSKTEVDEIESRRRINAWERTGQIVSREPFVGYLPLSTIYHVSFEPLPEAQVDTSAMGEQMLQLPLLEIED